MITGDCCVGRIGGIDDWSCDIFRRYHDTAVVLQSVVYVTTQTIA
jgi:hypothetical protein